MKINSFRGDLTDISAVKEALHPIISNRTRDSNCYPKVAVEGPSDIAVKYSSTFVE